MRLVLAVEVIDLETYRDNSACSPSLVRITTETLTSEPVRCECLEFKL
jgi:hypothetical protein